MSTAIEMVSAAVNAVWPLIANAFTFGAGVAVAGFVLKVLWGKWQQRPLIKHDLEFSGDRDGIKSARLKVTIYNRAPAPLDFNGIEVISPDTVLVRENQRNQDFAKTVLMGVTLPPSLPSATEFSKTTAWLDLSWPDEGCDASIQVKMRSKYQWVILRLLRISIRLPKKAATAQPIAKPTASSNAVKA